MLMPAPPRAGPTGGAGVPFPAGMFNLMTDEIFLAMIVSVGAHRRSGMEAVQPPQRGKRPKIVPDTRAVKR